MDRCTKIHHALNTEINSLLKKHADKGGGLLDVGCWDGGTTLTYGKSMATNKLFGIEGMRAPADQARKNGLTVFEVNLETDTWKAPASFFDVVVCNQVFEHLKNIFIPFDEIIKALRPGGILIISVPNLASFHNRAMLGLGLQPSSIRVWGPHVRGYASSEFLKFLTTGGFFESVETRGVGFYPFPPKAGGNILANIWKSACHTPVFVLRRTAISSSENFVSRYANVGAQTLM